LLKVITSKGVRRGLAFSTRLIDLLIKLVKGLDSLVDYSTRRSLRRHVANVNKLFISFSEIALLTLTLSAILLY